MDPGDGDSVVAWPSTPAKTPEAPGTTTTASQHLAKSRDSNESGANGAVRAGHPTRTHETDLSRPWRPARHKHQTGGHEPVVAVAFTHLPLTASPNGRSARGRLFDRPGLRVHVVTWHGQGGAVRDFRPCHGTGLGGKMNGRG